MSLLQMSFAGAVMIIVIVAVRRICFNQLPKRTFLILWELALVRLLIPVSVPFSLSIYTLIKKYKPINQTVIPTSDTINGVVVTTAPSTTMVSEAADVISIQMIIGEVLELFPVIWIVGMMLSITFFALSYVKGSRVFQMALPVNNGLIKNWLEKQHLYRPISVRQSKRIATPLTYGILRPVILMPESTDWGNDTQLQYILAHEYVHIRRLDALTKVLFTIALSIHWFNPFVWVMYVLVNRDIELSCDEAVVRMFGEEAKAAYARTLIYMEERKSNFSPLYSHFSKNATEERVRSIMKIKKISAFALAGAIMLVVGITAVFATSAKENLPNVADNYQERESMLVITGEEEATTHFSDGGYCPDILDVKSYWESINIIISAVDGSGEASVKVRFYEDKNWDQMAVLLQEEGFSMSGPNLWVKTASDTDVTTKIKTGEYVDGMWGIFCSYPAKDEEGWARSMAVAANDLAVSLTEDLQRPGK